MKTRATKVSVPDHHGAAEPVHDRPADAQELVGAVRAGAGAQGEVAQTIHRSERVQDLGAIAQRIQDAPRQAVGRNRLAALSGRGTEGRSAAPAPREALATTPSCRCAYCQGSGTRSDPVTQRSSASGPAVLQRTLLKGRVGPIEEQLQDLLDAWDESSPGHKAASKLFYQIAADTHDYNAQAWLRDAAAKTGLSDFEDIADSIDIGGVRSNYYPSGFDATARANRDDYVKKHPGAKSGWRCPGTGARPAHDADPGDVSIDHAVPVATHWNSVGYKTDKDSRKAWYNDTSNHEIMCRSCNSSKGSGGVSYKKLPDYAGGFGA